MIDKSWPMVFAEIHLSGMLLGGTMIADLALGVAPYLFKGGSALEYLTGVGPSGTFYTLHKASGKVIQSVVPALGKLADGVTQGLPVTQMLSLANPVPLYNTLLLHGLKSAVQLTNVLGVANLGVGLVNLGVGVYNAYQIRQVRKDLARLEGKVDTIVDEVEQVRQDIRLLGDFTAQSFAQVQGVLQSHGAALGILLDGQYILAQRLELLSAQIAEGFVSVQQVQIETDARRVRQQLESGALRTLDYWKVMRDRLSARQLPSPVELNRVIESGTEMRAWIDVTLREQTPESPARLPLLVSKAVALRMIAEARFLEHSNHPTNIRELSEFVEEVSQAARALCQDRTPWELATSFKPVLDGYVYLHRGLTQGAVLGVGEDATAIPVVPTSTFVWDDGLVAVRALGMPAAVQAEVVAKWSGASSENDQAWTERFRGETGTDPSPELVARLLGAPPAIAVDDSTLRQARSLSLHRGRSELGHRLEREFGWESPPRILPGDANGSAPSGENDE
jgi:hypothetical protein